MNVIALLHLCCPQPLHGTAHCSLPAQGWCGTGFQQLQFIFALCVSLGDIKLHLSRYHLISFSGSCLSCDESFHLLFFPGCWRQSSRGFQGKLYCVLIFTRHLTVNQNIEYTFPVCRNDYEPITALYPYAVLLM